MNNSIWPAIISAVTFLVVSPASLAETCDNYIRMNESDFTIQASEAPVSIENTLQNCISSNYCSTMYDKLHNCAQRLMYFDAIAAFWVQRKALVASGSITPAIGPSPATGSTTAPTTPNNPQPTVSPSNTQHNQKTESAVEAIASPTNGPSDSTQSTDIYHNIKF